MKDPETRQSKGVAFIQYFSRDEANQAIEAFHGKEVYFRELIPIEITLLIVVKWTNIKM